MDSFFYAAGSHASRSWAPRIYPMGYVLIEADFDLSTLADLALQPLWEGSSVMACAFFRAPTGDPAWLDAELAFLGDTNTCSPAFGSALRQGYLGGDVMDSPAKIDDIVKQVPMVLHRVRGRILMIWQTRQIWHPYPSISDAERRCSGPPNERNAS